MSNTQNVITIVSTKQYCVQLNTQIDEHKLLQTGIVIHLTNCHSTVYSLYELELCSFTGSLSYRSMFIYITNPLYVFIYIHTCIHTHRRRRHAAIQIAASKLTTDNYCQLLSDTESPIRHRQFQ
jgi:hypothetical protein